MTPKVIEKFKKQLADVVPGEIRTAEDLLKLPADIRRGVQRQIEAEEMDEALRTRGTK